MIYLEGKKKEIKSLEEQGQEQALYPCFEQQAAVDEVQESSFDQNYSMVL